VILKPFRHRLVRPFTRGFMKRSRTACFLLVLAFLTNAALGQQVDWEDVVFTSIARARPGCVLAAGYDVTRRDFFLEDCQVTQNLIFPFSGHVWGIDFTNSRDGWLVSGSAIVPFRDGKTREAPKLGDDDWRFVGVSFYDEANGCAITSDGHVACTHD